MQVFLLLYFFGWLRLGLDELTTPIHTHTHTHTYAPPCIKGRFLTFPQTGITTWRPGSSSLLFCLRGCRRRRWEGKSKGSTCIRCVSFGVRVYGRCTPACVR
ncbi:hypothetical protein J3E74DRAFT_33567 [Bipolaris maydis]|nr:hypothetical protein J3E74DRAFT_33567 [Bipolaris maydis]